MKTEVENDIHKVVYIDYSNGVPHLVVTQEYIPDATNGPYWRNNFWDCFANEGDNSDLYLHHSGSGGEIQAPIWADGYTGIFWMDESCKFKGEPKNYKRIKHPRIIKSLRGASRNPFIIAEVTHCNEFCEVCNHSSIDVCWDHIYEDEDDHYELKYKHDNSPYN